MSTEDHLARGAGRGGGDASARAAPAPTFVAIHAPRDGSVQQEIVAGLARSRAALSPKFLYDRLGSALFGAITELAEYYPTRTEAAIFEAHAGAMADALRERLGQDITLVDLGAGDGAKAARLFDVLGVTRYVAVDISIEHLRAALNALQLRHPAVQMTGVGIDFSRELALPEGLLDGPALVFYPGSSIGNFDAGGARRLLAQARMLARGGGLLVGVDLCKPAPLLHAAYDDALGVTAAFNLNLLRHVNALIGSDFDVRDWRHEVVVGAHASHVEMHLRARRDLSVRWPGGGRDFAAGEGIHTENSHKWDAAQFEALLRDAGWRQVRRWTDAQGWFGVFCATA